MDGSNINLGNNFNQKDAEKKNISLRYFLHDYPDIHSRGGIKFSRGKQIPISGGRLIPKLTAMYTGVSTPEWTGG